MRLGFSGELLDEPVVRIGFVGCGSHACRNLFPVLQFVPVELVATCDLEADKAGAYAKKFGAAAAYDDMDEMLEAEELDGVLICTGYGDDARPTHPELAMRCMEAGCHAWTEKPPAATCAEVERAREVEQRTGKFWMVGYKTQFFPANEKAKELSERDEFGDVRMVTLQRPVNVPAADAIRRYLEGEAVNEVLRFLDHICHISSLLVFLVEGMPETMYYERTRGDGGLVTFRYASGLVAGMALTEGQSYEGGIERTMIVGSGHHVVVDNNIRLEYHRGPARPEGSGYGGTPSHFTGPPEATTATWHPEFSLGQLYSKGLFTQGFYGEILEFAEAVREDRAPAKSHSGHIWQTTRIFEAFAHGPGHAIPLQGPAVEA